MNAIGRIRAAVLVLAATTLVALALPSVASALTRAQANRIALAALRPAALQRPVVVYGLPRPVSTSDHVVQEAVPIRHGRRSLAPPGTQWVFFEDLVPDAYFDHPGRLLFVSDRTGRVSASIATQSYPLVNGRAPFIEPAPRRYVVFAQPRALAAVRRTTSVAGPAAAAAADALPAGSMAGECILTVGDEGPDQKSFGPDLDQVKFTAARFRIPVYPLPKREDGSAPDGTDLPAFATKLVKDKHCKDILIFLAGHGRPGVPGVWVARDGEGVPDRTVDPKDLRKTMADNPETTFKIILDSCHSGLFVPELPASIKNLLVLSVSSAADEVSYNGYAWVVTNKDGQEFTRPKPTQPRLASGFVLNFTAGWRAFADSPSAVSAAQAAGGSLFAHMIAEGQAMGGGLDWPASKGVEVTHPMTYELNLPHAQTGSALKACAIQAGPTQDLVKVGEQGAAGAQGAVVFNTGGTPQARTFILANVTPIPDALVGPFTAPTSGFATITVTLNLTPTGPPQTFNFTFPANSASSSDCTFPNPP
jgi:hypothetical protein